MSNNKLKLSIEEALNKKEELVKECKLLGAKFSRRPETTIWSKLEKAEQNLNTIHLALLTVNETKKNNSRIKERELLVKKLDVLNKSTKYIAQKITSLGSLFSSWINKFKNKVDIEPLQSKIQSRIQQLTKELEDFNKTNFIVVELV